MSSANLNSERKPHSSPPNYFIELDIYYTFIHLINSDI